MPSIIRLDAGKDSYNDPARCLVVLDNDGKLILIVREYYGRALKMARLYCNDKKKAVSMTIPISLATLQAFYVESLKKGLKVYAE